jgi:pimeloyl-ACP methyl ester carboxylesterase
VAFLRNNIGPLSIYLRDSALTQTDRPDVVMIQGFGTGPRCMRPMAEHLSGYGHRCAVAPIGGFLGHLQTRSIARAASRLDDYLSSLPADCQPWLIGHSIGGIIARQAIQEGRAGRRVSGLITLGAPHRGCPAAAAGLMIGLGLFSTAPWSITPISPLIRRLNTIPWPRPIPLISIATEGDLLCRPRHSQIQFADDRLIRNITIGRHGHTQMLRSEQVLDAIATLIAAPAAAQSA